MKMLRLFERLDGACRLINCYYIEMTPTRMHSGHAPISHLAPKVLGARTPVAQRKAELTFAI